MKKSKILFLQHERCEKFFLKQSLMRNNFEVVEISLLQNFFTLLSDKMFALVVVGPSFPGYWDVLEVTREIRRYNPSLPLMIITQNSSEERILQALKLGVNDFFKLPVSENEFLASIERILQLKDRCYSYPEDSDGSFCSAMLGKTPQMRDLKAQLINIARTDSTVLITGETGTGKELAAKIIHQASPRQAQPFVCVNCAALPDTLIESELFGYERGAFTGAVRSRSGKFEEAEGGTILLDEIGDMQYLAQAKILRVLEERTVCRLGGRQSIPIDIRVIAATNRGADTLMEGKQFRKDLYYRLNVAQINLPPLRERKEDIPLLIEYFLDEMNRRFGRHVIGVTDEALETLLVYDWPGNIRELKNLIEAAFINQPAMYVERIDLPKIFLKRIQATKQVSVNERDQILAALFATNWNKSRAAKKLNWSRMSLYRKMEKYQISLTTITE